MLSLLFGLSFLYQGAGHTVVLDASGSMWGRMQGKSKIEWARESMEQMLVGLEDGTPFGLVAYGHRKEGDCSDIETIVAYGPLNKAEVMKRVIGLKPKGKTPIHNSLKHTFDQLKGKGATTVILLSDGLETCDGDACKLTAAFVKDQKALVHVVGFGLDQSKGLDTLECLAQAGGGSFFDVQKGADLSGALQTAVAQKVDDPTAWLEVGAKVNGQLVDVSVHVLQKRKLIAGGRTYAKPETNPRKLAVPEGVWDVKITAVRIDGSPVQTHEKVKFVTGETHTINADFSMGTMTVSVKSNGKLHDATVKLSYPATGKSVTATRSYERAKTNPVTFQVPPGVYDLEVKSVKIKGAAPERFEGLEIVTGQTTAREVSFDSGTLAISAKTGDQLLDCVVNVRPPGKRKAVAAGRTYKSAKTNPKSFLLRPGTYEITAKPTGKNASQEQTQTVVVNKGQIATVVFQF